MSKLATVVLGCAIAAAAVPTFAQGNVDPAKSMDHVVSALEGEIVPLAEAMPADKYNFAPTAADFKTLKPEYTGVSTFGQMVAHMAAANYSYGSAFSGLKPNVDVKTVTAQTDKEHAVAALKQSFAFLHQAAGSLTAANAFEHVGRNPDDSRISIATQTLAHDNDHYGQLVEYLRMNGMVPPASQHHGAARK